MLYTGTNVNLRRFELSDISDKYIDWLNNKEYMRYSNQRHFTHTYETTSQYVLSFENSSNLFLSIKDSNSQLIGTCTIYYDPYNLIASLGVLISPEVSGQGIAKEVFKILLSELPSDLRVHKIIAGTCESNKKMISVIENSSMALEYREPKEFFLDGKFLDNLIFAKYYSI